MEERKPTDKPLRDLIEIIQFTENVSTKIHGLMNESEIYNALKEEFAKSKRYTTTVLLLTEDGLNLRIAATSQPLGKLEAAEKVTSLKLKEYKIDLEKSGILSKVVKEGETFQVNFGDLIGEFLPRPLSHLAMKIMGYEKKSILTPLHRHGKIIGVFGMTFTELAGYFIPSVKNLAQHISTALELAEEYTERKKAEETLRQSEEKYRKQFEEALDAIFVGDAETGIIIDCNREASELVGREKSELVGKHQRILHPPEEIEGEFSRTFKQHLKEKEGQVLETQVITKRGEIKDVAIKANVIEFQGKRLIQGIFRDITERKKMEETLRESGEKFRNLFQNARDTIITLDLKGKITSVNKVVAEYGFKEDEIIGKSMLKFVPKKYWPKMLKDLAKVSQGNPVEGEIEIFTPKGKKISEYRSNSIKRENEVVGFQSILRDITERKRMEEALVYERDLLQALMDNIPDAIYFKDAASRFTRINRAHAQRMGLNDPEGAIGKTDFDFYEEKFAQETYADEQEIVKTGQSLIGKIEKIWMKDGKNRYVSATKVPIKDKEGRVMGTVGISRDITNLKQMEEELRRYSTHLEELVEERTRKLREVERMAAIGETAAMVGHDLRNPLQVIVNTVYLLKKLSESELPQYREGENKRGYVDLFRAIEAQVGYMNKIVADLQDYARPVEPDFVENGVHQLINETLSTVTIPETVEVSKMIPEDLPLLMADPALMKRVFTNLITNALQAMPNGGQLTIEAHTTEESMFISFQDTGVGIPEGNFPKLFQPLFTSKSKGTGFGLAVCKRLVEAHDGNITFESKVGRGSTFTVKLPLRKEVS